MYFASIIKYSFIIILSVLIINIIKRSLQINPFIDFLLIGLIVIVLTSIVFISFYGRTKEFAYIKSIIYNKIRTLFRKLGD